MDWHPYAKLFPMLPDTQIEELADDIRKNGLRNPIIVDTHERIIDGRNRSEACMLAGVEPVLDVFPGNDREILDLVCSLNIHRRHLSESQRASIAATIANMPAHATAADKRRNNDASIDASEQVITQSEAAKLMNVSRSSVGRAAVVQKKASDEVKADVAAGKLSLAKAAQVAKLPAEQQNELREQGYREPVHCVGLDIARKVIAALKRVPRDDPERQEAFDMVADWLVENMGG